jgi:MoaA/NifB/PqqE/SkfB family radical SAM enzyme
MDTRRIIMIGEGEPFLHPRVLDLIEMCKSSGFEVFVVTNGTLINASMANRLVELGVDRLQISLWTSDPEDYEIQCGRAGDKLWSATMEGMQLLTSAKRVRRRLVPKVILHQPLNRINYRALERTAQVAIDAGCNGITFSPYLDHGGMLAQYAIPDEELPIVFQTLRGLRAQLTGRLTHNIDEILFRYRYPRVWETAACYVAWMDARVRIDGTVVPCNGCQIVLGDLKRGSMRDIWNDAPFRSFRRCTRDRASLRALRDTCFCDFCCHLRANISVHRLARWLTIPAPRRGRSPMGRGGHAAGE